VLRWPLGDAWRTHTPLGEALTQFPSWRPPRRAPDRRVLLLERGASARLRSRRGTLCRLARTLARRLLGDGDVGGARLRDGARQGPRCYRRSYMRKLAAEFRGHGSATLRDHRHHRLQDAELAPGCELIAAPATLSGRTRGQTHDHIGVGTRSGARSRTGPPPDGQRAGRSPTWRGQRRTVVAWSSRRLAFRAALASADRPPRSRLLHAIDGTLTAPRVMQPGYSAGGGSTHHDRLLSSQVERLRAARLCSRRVACCSDLGG